MLSRGAYYPDYTVFLIQKSVMTIDNYHIIYQRKNYFLSVTNDIASNPYVNEPGFMHTYFLSQSNDDIAKKLALK